MRINDMCLQVSFAGSLVSCFSDHYSITKANKGLLPDYKSKYVLRACVFIWDY